jgi:hypothetical protein
MTPHEIELAKALNRCSGWVGARFISDAAATANLLPQHEISLRQRHYLEILAWRYRRQLPSHLVPEVKPPALPKTHKESRRAKQNAPAPDLFSLAANW